MAKKKNQKYVSRYERSEYVNRPRRPKGKKFTPEELKLIQELYEERDNTVSEIVEIVGCSRTSVINVSRELGLTRSPKYYKKYPNARRSGEIPIEYIVDAKTKRDMIETIMGGGSIQQLIRDGYIPSMFMFNRLLSKDEAFRKEYNNARLVATHTFVDQLVDLSSSILTDEDIDPNRVRIATDIKRALAKMINPSEYGERQQILHSNDDIKQPTINIITGGTTPNDINNEEQEHD